MRWAKACVIDNRSFAGFATASLNPSNRSIGCRSVLSLTRALVRHFANRAWTNRGPYNLKRSPFFGSKIASICGRPVLTPSRWKLRRAICIQRNAAAHWRRRVLNNFGPCADQNVNARATVGNSRQNVLMGVYCSVTCKQAAYSKRDRSIKQYHITH